MLRQPFVSSVVASFLISLACQSAPAVEPPVDQALRGAVKAIVVDPWTKSADGLAKAEAAYKQAQAHQDARIGYAWALIQLRYLRAEEADKTLNGVLAADPDQWDARRLQIRLAAQMKKHVQALDQLDRLSLQLAAAADDAARADERKDTIEFLGKMFAFYQSPAAKGVPTTLADVRGRVVERLAPAEREAFAVAAGEADATAPATPEQPVVADAAKPAADPSATPAVAAAPADDQEAKLKQAADAEARAREIVAKLDTEMRQIDEELKKANNQGAGMRAEIARLEVGINQLNARANASNDDDEEALLLQQAIAGSSQLRTLQENYQTLDAQATKLVTRRNALSPERMKAVAAYDAEMKTLGMTPVKIAGARPTSTTAGLKTGASPSAGAPTSLGSFIDLSLEPEKKRLLAKVGL